MATSKTSLVCSSPILCSIMSCRSSSEALANFLLELIYAEILIRAVATGSWPANGADLTNASAGATSSVFRRLFGGISSSPSAFRVCLCADSGGRLPNKDDILASKHALQEYCTSSKDRSRDQRPSVGAHRERNVKGKLWERTRCALLRTASVVLLSTFQEVCRPRRVVPRTSTLLRSVCTKAVAVLSVKTLTAVEFLVTQLDLSPSGPVICLNERTLGSLWAVLFTACAQLNNSTQADCVASFGRLRLIV